LRDRQPGQTPDSAPIPLAGPAATPCHKLQRSLVNMDDQGGAMPQMTSTQSIPRAAPAGLTERKGVSAMGDARRIRRIYWIATGLVSSVMVFSAINFNLKNPLGPMKGAFVHLGYPSYFRIELTVAKVLGVVALLVPAIPLKVKEFAYAGFA